MVVFWLLVLRVCVCVVLFCLQNSVFYFLAVISGISCEKCDFKVNAFSFLYGKKKISMTEQNDVRAFVRSLDIWLYTVLHKRKRTMCNCIITMGRRRKLESMWGLRWLAQCIFSWRRKNEMWFFIAMGGTKGAHHVAATCEPQPRWIITVFSPSGMPENWESPLAIQKLH